MKTIRLNGRLLLSTVAVGALLCCASGAQAQAAAEPESDEAANNSQLGEIIVTAQRRSENLQNVPIVVSSIDSTALQQARVTDINDVAKLVPGFRGNGDSATSSAHLRGAGNATISAGNDSAVAYYVDGIYIPTSLTGQIDVRGADRIEVLKGPQGTLFGRNSTAGVVQIVSRKPADKFELEAELGYGNFETMTAYGYVGTPINDWAAANFQVSARFQGEGWGTNVATGRDVRKVDNEIAMRGKVVLDPSASTKIILSGDYQKTEGVGLWAFGLVPSPQLTGLGLFSIGNSPWNVNNDVVPLTRARGTGVSATITQELGAVTLTSITAYRDHRFAIFNLDYDATAVPGLVYNDVQTSKQLTQELQLSSSGDGPLTWTIGGFYFNAKDTNFGDVVISPLFQPGFGNIAVESTRGTQRTKSIAGYGQATYEIADGTRLTLGGRYTSERRKFNAPHALTLSDGTVVPLPTGTGSETFNVPTFRVALNQDITPDVMAYASVNRGFKSGGFNISNASNPPFRPEKLTAYEVGLKTTLFDRLLRLNLAGFYYDYKDLQLSAFPTGTGSNQGLQIIYNAAAAKFYGLNADFDLRPFPGFSLSGGIELLGSEYGDFPNAAISSPNPMGGYTTVSGDVSGSRAAQAPTFSGSLVASYEFDTGKGRFNLSADASYNSGYFLLPGNEFKQRPFTLVGASIRYTTADEHFYVQAWGKNLANEPVVGLFITSPLAQFATYDAPRTYGLTAGFKF